MYPRMGMCLLALVVGCAVVAQQDPAAPVLRKGVSVQMPVSSQATVMRDADAEDATVITVTAKGSVYVGMRPAALNSLGQLNAKTVYVKADARVPYQHILKVLDALHGHSVVLLASSPTSAEKTGIAPPYGIKVAFGGE